MIQTAPASDDMYQMASPYDYPHMIVMILLTVVLTASVEFWSARQSPDKTPFESVNPLAWFVAFVFLIVKSIFIVFFIYYLPASIIVALIKTQIGGESISAASFATEVGDPTLKFAFMICLTDSFAETLRYNEKGSFISHFLPYPFLLAICYYGGMVVTWILARIIAAGGGFAPGNVEAAGDLFSPPVFVHDVTRNWMIIVALILIGGVLFHWVIERRRQWT